MKYIHSERREASSAQLVKMKKAFVLFARLISALECWPAAAGVTKTND